MTTQKKYTAEFKSTLVKRVCSPGGPSAYAVAREVGVSVSSVYDWVRKAQRGVMSSSSTSRSPGSWSASEKLTAVSEAGGLSDDALGHYLRENGLHEAHLSEWRSQCEVALKGKGASKVELRLKKENRLLSKELLRKERALAETAALLVLSKKVSALWGEEGDGT